MIYNNATPVRVGKNWHCVVNGRLCVVPVLAGRAAINEVDLEAAAAALDNLIVTEVPVQVPKLPPISEIPTNPNPPGERPIKPVDSVNPKTKPDPIIPPAQKKRVSEAISDANLYVVPLDEEELVNTKVRLTDATNPTRRVKKAGEETPATPAEVKTWNEMYFTDENVIPNVDTENTILESVDVYKSIDLVSEGEIAGLCDANGNLIQLVSDATNTQNSLEKNENGLRGIYLNDVPVKNTNSNTLNYTRVFAEIKYGTADQGMLAYSDNPALSLRASSQTFNVGLVLPDLNPTNYKAVWPEPVAFHRGKKTGQTYTKSTPAENETIPFQQGGSSETIPPGVRKSRFYEVDWYTDSPMNGYGLGGRRVMSNSPSYYSSRKGEWPEAMSRAFEVAPIKYQHTITNDNVTDIEVGLMGVLAARTNDGSIEASLNFAIKIGYADDDRMVDDGGSQIYVFAPIYGKSSDQYVRSYIFKLPIFERDRDRQITIVNMNLLPLDSKGAPYKYFQGRSGGVSYLSEVVTRNLSYPHSAIIGTIVDARAFANVPKRTFDLKLGKVKLPTNYNPETREYTNNWTGEFSINKYWSNNPAWIFYDLVTNPRYGLGKYGFGEGILDKWNLYSIGKYCDELVETGYRPEVPLMDFTIAPNGYTITIDDSVAQRGAAFFQEAGFTNNASAAFLRPKQSDGSDISYAFRRRIANPKYDTTSGAEKLTFDILKELSPEYVFRTYVTESSGETTEWLREGFKNSNDTNLSPAPWLHNYIVQNYHKVGTTTDGVPFEGDDFINTYTTGFPVYRGITQGKVGVESNKARALLEPRFTTNVYLDREQDAYNALNDLAAVFRGMLYWSSGFVFLSNDQVREAVLLFTNANVREGVFNYAGTAKTTRFTSVLIRYNDERDNFKPKVEYVEDAAGLRKFGHLEKKLIALGCTSRSQAHRLGKWFLFTNQTESDLIQFSTGTEASYLRPGDVVKVQDKLKNAKRYGGRLIDIDHNSNTVTLDEGVAEDVVGQKLTLLVPRDSRQVKALDKEAREEYQNNSNFKGIPQTKIDETRASQIKQFTVESVSVNAGAEGGPSNQITIVEKFDADFARVGKGTVWSLQNTNVSFQIEEIEYRILSIVEESPGDFQVNALIYNRSKFGAVDSSDNLTNTQASKPDITLITDANRPQALDGTATINELTGSATEGKVYATSFAERTSSADVAVEVNFDDLRAAVAPAISAQNTGGYLVDIYVGGAKRTIILNGYNNTSFYAFLGNKYDQTNIECSIYRFDTDYILQATGDPDE